MNCVIRLILIILVFVVTCVRSYSQSNSGQTVSLQDSSVSKVGNDNSLKNGMWAIQFGIGSNLSLQNFDGLINIKRHISNRIALRFGADFNFHYYENEDRGDKNWSYAINTNLVCQYYLNPKSKFNVYLAAGPLLEYIYDKSYFFQDFNLHTAWNAGVYFGVGTEYFIAKEFSLFAEYNSALRVGRHTDEYSFGSETEKRSDFSSSFQSGYLKFGASVYF